MKTEQHLDRRVRLFDYEEEDHSCTRFSNPTHQRVLEKLMGALGGGAAALR